MPACKSANKTKHSHYSEVTPPLKHLCVSKWWPLAPAQTQRSQWNISPGTLEEKQHRHRFFIRPLIDIYYEVIPGKLWKCTRQTPLKRDSTFLNSTSLKAKPRNWEGLPIFSKKEHFLSWTSKMLRAENYSDKKEIKLLESKSCSLRFKAETSPYSIICHTLSTAMDTGRFWQWGSGRIGEFCHYLCVLLNLGPLSLQQCQQGLQGSITGLSVCKGTGRTENDSRLWVTWTTQQLQGTSAQAADSAAPHRVMHSQKYINKFKNINIIQVQSAKSWNLIPIIYL